jgi:hypothetical protein
MMGYLTGLYALNFKWGCFGEDDAVKVLRILRAVVPGLMDMDFRAEDLVKKVRSKVAKFRRGGENRRGEAENGQ